MLRRWSDQIVALAAHHEIPTRWRSDVLDEELRHWEDAPQAIKDVGTYPVTVISQGDFASRSTPTYLIVYISFKR